MLKQPKTVFEVGERVTHKLMGWEGIVAVDLVENIYGSEHYGVKFNIDGKLEYRVVYDVEIEKNGIDHEQS